jgi:L-seryl-tRNA(Ser) seleniumtransferase
VTAGLGQRRVALQGPLLRRVLNGTGVLLHTNAGRAPLPQVALAALLQTAKGYCNLEFSLQTGRRGSRQDHVRPLLQWLTGAEDALVVNNGAAAVLLALHALARGREVVVSRGELVEIGGGFRIPEVMTAAGCTLREVGTTNRTHLRDVRAVLSQGPAVARQETGKNGVAAILQVHRSNFAIVGFTATPDLSELAALAHTHDLPLIVDLGSGALAPLPEVLVGPEGLPHRREPTVQEVLAAGADLVTFSGDKLIGGPQAGLIVGKSKWIQQLASNPMARALRVDNLTLAALEAVLRVHLRGRAEQELPAVRAAALPEPEIEALAVQLLQTLEDRLGEGWVLAIEPADARLGGGVDPLLRAPSRALAVTRTGLAAPKLAKRLRQVDLPVLGRVRGERLLLDVRTLLAGQGDADWTVLADELTRSLRAAGE